MHSIKFCNNMWWINHLDIYEKLYLTISTFMMFIYFVLSHFEVGSKQQIGA